MEFDQYGRIKNPNIPSTGPLDNYTHTRNHRTSSTFFLWDWFNDLVIGIGNLIATGTEYIISALAWIAIIGGGIWGIVQLVDVWTHHSFIAAIFITIFGGTILYYIFMFILGILFWVVSIGLAIIRYIFYNAYTLLLTILICGWLAWHNGSSSSSTAQREPVRSTITTEPTTRYRVTASTLNVRREPYTGSPVIGKLHRYDFVEVYSFYDGFAQIKYGGSKAWASEKYLELY